MENDKNISNQKDIHNSKEKISPYEQLMWNNINKTKEKVSNFESSHNTSNLNNRVDKINTAASKNGNTAANITTNNRINTTANSNVNTSSLNKNANITSNNKNAAPVKIKASLGKNCRVFLKPSFKQIAKILAGTPDSSYDIKSNEWSFPVGHYDSVAKALSASGVAFEHIPAGTLKLAKRTYQNTPHTLQGGIYDILMDFQREAVNFAINRSGRILLADDMGLGKTIQALAIANYYKLEYPLLILSPASLCYNWLDSIQRFLNEEATIVREKSDFGGKIVIISYNLAVSFIDVINKYGFGVVICDECHYLKSTTSKRTRELLPLLQKVSRLVMISGTPATSRPLELYPILCALDKTLYPSFPGYGNRYCGGKKIGMYFDYKGCTNAVELSVVLEKAFMIRRVKEDVLDQLPKKFRRQIVIEGMKTPRLIEMVEMFGDAPDATLMMEYANAALIKKEPVLKYLESVLEKNIKCIVFAHHKEMLDALESYCIEKNICHVRIDGTTPAAKRQGLVDSYQNEDRIRVAILSLTACSTGLTLTSGKAVIFAELYWNPGTMLQAEDRIHRIGQKDNVDIHYLVAKNTVDEIVWPKLLQKLTVLESLGMSKNELKTVKGVNVGEKVQGRLDLIKK